MRTEGVPGSGEAACCHPGHLWLSQALLLCVTWPHTRPTVGSFRDEGILLFLAMVFSLVLGLLRGTSGAILHTKTNVIVCSCTWCVRSCFFALTSVARLSVLPCHPGFCCRTFPCHIMFLTLGLSHVSQPKVFACLGYNSSGQYLLSCW